MTAPLQSVDPETVGLAGERLARIDGWMSRYVDSGKLPGAMVGVARRGKLAFLAACGLRDVERGLSVEEDTIFRIYSMTKPITSVAMLMLYEEGRFQLDDPVSRFLPGFADLKVYTGGGVHDYHTESMAREMTIRDLFTHTSGLTYDFIDETPVGTLYQQHRVRHVFGNHDFEEFVARLCEVPLLCQPGTEWNYSVSTDVLGYLVQLISGTPFQTFLQERIFAPLGMTDTDFWVPEDKLERFACCYQPAGPEGGLELTDQPEGSIFAAPRTFHSGGGGLVSTMGDYLRFAQMLAGRGELDGARLLGRKTVEYMTVNHLPGDLAALGQPRFSETSFEGIGFGLGVSVVIDPARTQALQSLGTYAWGGMASTAFWVDPREEIVTILLTQLQPSSSYPLRNELRVLVNQAVVD